jgi:hypothetical protein
MISFVRIMWCKIVHVRHWRFERIGERNAGKCTKCFRYWLEPY